MPEQDYAIVVGISRYRNHDKYPPLDGPLNDVESVVKWLQHPAGGGITEDERIITLRTPDELLPSPPPGGWPESTKWQPNKAVFSDAFDAITLDENKEFIRREGRLYLYFSGHGFSRVKEQDTAAALYGADNLGRKTENLAGTLYAQAAQNAMLFKEVVLIMDCCRDTESNVNYSAPDFNNIENDGSQTVRMLAIYAAPKRGKAQERELDDLKVVGLLTNGWLKALREAPCDVLGRVSSKALSQYVGLNWKNWYPTQTPPEPRFIPPQTGDIYFNSGRSLRDQVFTVPAGTASDLLLRLKSDTHNAIGMFSGEIVLWRDANSAWEGVASLTTAEDGSKTFTLRLPPEEHAFINAMTAERTVFTPGGADVVL